jgi:hypothetical protein
MRHVQLTSKTTHCQSGCYATKFRLKKTCSKRQVSCCVERIIFAVVGRSLGCVKGSWVCWKELLPLWAVRVERVRRARIRSEATKADSYLDLLVIVGDQCLDDLRPAVAGEMSNLLKIRVSSEVFRTLRDVVRVTCFVVLSFSALASDLLCCTVDSRSSRPFILVCMLSHTMKISIACLQRY